MTGVGLEMLMGPKDQKERPRACECLCLRERLHGEGCEAVEDQCHHYTTYSIIDAMFRLGYKSLPEKTRK